MVVYIITYILVGITAGLLSGFLGIGGGIIIVPAFVCCLGMSQHMAQGTSLALMVPPITFIAAYKYFKNGNVDITVALFVCMGFVLGGFLGAKGAHFFHPQILEKIFGVFLLIVGIKMVFFS